MEAIASQITSLTIVYSTVYSDADQRKYQSSASLVFVRGIHRRPVNSSHKLPVTRKMSPFDDVIMWDRWLYKIRYLCSMIKSRSFSYRQAETLFMVKISNTDFRISKLSKTFWMSNIINSHATPMQLKATNHGLCETFPVFGHSSTPTISALGVTGKPECIVAQVAVVFDCTSRCQLCHGKLQPWITTGGLAVHNGKSVVNQVKKIKHTLLPRAICFHRQWIFVSRIMA